MIFKKASIYSNFRYSIYFWVHILVVNKLEITKTPSFFAKSYFIIEERVRFQQHSAYFCHLLLFTSYTLMLTFTVHLQINFPSSYQNKITTTSHGVIFTISLSTIQWKIIQGCISYLFHFLLHSKMFALIFIFTTFLYYKKFIGKCVD